MQLMIWSKWTRRFLETIDNNMHHLNLCRQNQTLPLQWLMSIWWTQEAHCLCCGGLVVMCHCFRMIDVDLWASSWLASRRRMKVLMINSIFVWQEISTEFFGRNCCQRSNCFQCRQDTHIYCCHWTMGKTNKPKNISFYKLSVLAQL